MHLVGGETRICDGWKVLFEELKGDLGFDCDRLPWLSSPLLWWAISEPGCLVGILSVPSKKLIKLSEIEFNLTSVQFNLMPAYYGRYLN